jgi:hypothetical protein
MPLPDAPVVGWNTRMISPPRGSGSRPRCTPLQVSDTDAVMEESSIAMVPWRLVVVLVERASRIPCSV